MRSSDNEGSLPNLIIIGAQKCGTTSLHYYLGFHPQIKMSREKELRFFLRERNWPRGLEWYKSKFVGEADVYGESTPAYTDFPTFRGVAARMHSVVPRAKLIYMVRDPLERIVSSYVHNLAMGREDRSISAALADLDPNPYVQQSKYYMQLEQYLRFFRETSILIVQQKNLLHRRRETLQQVFRFLQVDDSFHSLHFARRKHQSTQKRRRTAGGDVLSGTRLMRAVERQRTGVRWKIETVLYYPFSRRIARPELDDDLRQALIEHLREDANRLRAYSGWALDDWSV